MKHWIDDLPDELFEELLSSDLFKAVRKYCKTTEEAIEVISQLLPPNTENNEDSNSK